MNMDSPFTKRVKSHHEADGSGQFAATPQTLAEALSEKRCPTGNNTLYVHVPFCSKICSFCNMRRVQGIPDSDYADLLLRHMALLSAAPYVASAPIGAVYFGGGTPTTLKTADITRILTGIRECFRLRSDVEITFESSLADLDAAKLEVMMRGGVNRLSIGIQTFSDKGRVSLGRRGDRAFALDRLKQLRGMGLHNLNIDLIYNYPGETVAMLRDDLENFLALDLAGFSYYSLILMKNSPLTRLAKAEALSEDARSERDQAFFSEVMHFRNTHDLQQLELTKIIRPDRDRYQYIRNRLAGNQTFPLGAGAGGNIGTAVFMNPLDLASYRVMLDNFSAVRGMGFEEDYYRLKRITNQLQLASLDLETVEAPFTDVVRDFMDEMSLRHYAKKSGSRYVLTDNGIFWGNSLSAKLWETLSALTGQA